MFKIGKIIIVYLLLNFIHPLPVQGAIKPIEKSWSKPLNSISTVVFNYKNVTVNYSYEYSFPFDKIDSIDSSIYANRDNYSLNYFCYNESVLVYTAYYIKCDDNCTFYLYTPYFVNLCKFVIYSNKDEPLFVNNINVTVTYENLSPEPLPTPVPLPPDNPPEPKGLGPGVISGIVIGCVVVVGLLVTGGYFLWKHMRVRFNRN